MKKTISVPIKSGSDWNTKELPYESVLESFIKSVNKMPDIISALKKADNEQWGKLVEDLAKHVENDKQLSEILRVDKEGVLHIGEPNWASRLLIMAYMYGYSVGSACFRAGHCDYTSYVS